MAIILGWLAAPWAQALTRIQLPPTGLQPHEVAILVNDDDPLSRQVGIYYQKARRIPDANLIRMHFTPGQDALSKEQFIPLKAEIDRRTPSHVQAFAVAWTTPYRVGCMSLTSALALGYDEKYCSKTCGPTAPSPYFNSTTQQPASQLGLRPAMMLAGTDFTQVKALIDRGVAADSTFPAGRAYLLNTSDKNRSVRATYFKITAKEFGHALPVEILDADAIENRQDVLFYFTGLAVVPKLDTLRFLPGALADHLTSAGGQLTGSSQMSSLRWLEAGATASYGTVVEPCNHLQKFPFPAIAMAHYLRGATAIEAYWKSVAWPGEGVFIGEPLAAPFAPAVKEIAPGQFELGLFSTGTGLLRGASAGSPIGPFTPIPNGKMLQPGPNLLRFTLPQEGYLRLEW
ncbi:MAG: TIGR03790 family protein [Deltaproteobacteria bacterium]|nr:TIGR03790 family protein [Deltaproteobacteria bacterium]